MALTLPSNATRPGGHGVAGASERGANGLGDLRVGDPPLLVLVSGPVDRDAVEDRVGQQADPGHRGVQVVGGAASKLDGFAHVSPGGGYADLKSAGQGGQGERQSVSRNAVAPCVAGIPEFAEGRINQQCTPGYRSPRTHRPGDRGRVLREHHF
jgi:hypothetical protein